MSPALLLIAFLGGVCPAFIWLFFWLLEDRCQPEPKRYIFFAFVAGMAGTLIALPLEKYVAGYFSSGFALFLSWATIEELLKFGAAYFVALRFAVYDEPLDAVIYMVTAALGFSALENALFLWTPLQQGDILRALVTEDLRFMGATLLHTLASVTIGVSLALSYYMPAAQRKISAIVGVILAITLHTLFNFFILQEGSTATFWIFLCIWVGVIAALLVTERIKQPAKDYC
jgi:RsiW-degrading membrane proteinase PrsW (M82 family)